MANPKSIEDRLRHAIEAGEFDNLPGKGKPLDLSAYFAAPEEIRMGYQMLKDNSFVPEEVSLPKEIGGLREKIAKEDDASRGKLGKELREKEMALRMILERNSRRG